MRGDKWLSVTVCCTECNELKTYRCDLADLDDTSIFSVMDDAIDFIHSHGWKETAGKNWLCARHAQENDQASPPADQPIADGDLTFAPERKSL